jgi:hypothetical protein
MPAKTIKRRLTEAGDRELAEDGGLVDALERAVSRSRDLPMHRGYVFGRKLELREEALRLGRELLRGTKYEQER